jgi:hypothetical protein
MIRLLLLSAIALSLASCASAPPSGLSLEYNGHIGIVPYRLALGVVAGAVLLWAYNGHIGIVPYRLAYQGGKATVAISTPWRRIRPDNSK